MSKDVLQGKFKWDGERVKQILLDHSIYIVIIVIFLGMAAVNPGMLQLRNIEIIINQASTRIILALGMAGIILTGNIDVAQGRIIGLAGVVVASLVQSLDNPHRIFDWQLPIIVPIIGVMILCGLTMFVIGVIIAKMRIPAFIATLSFSLIVFGLNSLYFDVTNNSAPIGGLDDAFRNLTQGGFHIAGVRISHLVIFASASIATIWFIWNKTALGKNMYAVGGNSEAAHICGVNVAKTISIVFLIAGILYGIAGVLEAGRIGSAHSGLGFGFELDAIAACVVGGVSMRGGKGKITGIVVGVLVFQLITFGLTFLGVNPYLQFLFKGLIILFAVLVDAQKNIKRV